MSYLVLSISLTVLPSLVTAAPTSCLPLFRESKGEFRVKTYEEHSRFSISKDSLVGLGGSTARSIFNKLHDVKKDYSFRGDELGVDQTLAITNAVKFYTEKLEAVEMAIDKLAIESEPISGNGHIGIMDVLLRLKRDLRKGIKGNIKGLRELQAGGIETIDLKNLKDVDLHRQLDVITVTSFIEVKAHYQGVFVAPTMGLADAKALRVFDRQVNQIVAHNTIAKATGLEAAILFVDGQYGISLRDNPVDGKYDFIYSGLEI